MSAAIIIPIGTNPGVPRQATWSLIKLARPGHAPVALGIVLVDADNDDFSFLLRDSSGIEELAELDRAVIEALPADLEMKAQEMGGNALLGSLEDSLSHFLHISNRTPVSFSGPAQVAVKRLFEEHVESGRFGASAPGPSMVQYPADSQLRPVPVT